MAPRYVPAMPGTPNIRTLRHWMNPARTNWSPPETAMSASVRMPSSRMVAPALGPPVMVTSSAAFLMMRSWTSSGDDIG